VEFWVTVATVLPVLALPMVLLARTQLRITYTRLRSSWRVRVLAGTYGSVLVLVYCVETAAVLQLASDPTVPGPEMLKIAAVATVGTVGGSLILSPGLDLFRMAFAGQGNDIKTTLALLRSSWEIGELRWSVFRSSRTSRRYMKKNIRLISRQAELLETAWTLAVRQGALIIDPSGDTQIAGWLRGHDDRRADLVSALRSLEHIELIRHINREKVARLRRDSRARGISSRRRLREQNLQILWRIFEDWNSLPDRSAEPAVRGESSGS
jgi:hypothetical protein